MENQPSLSQYFGETEAPPASQFFDEIGSSPSDMITSIYLGNSEVKETTADLFDDNAVPFSSPQTIDMSFESVVPTVSSPGGVPAASLPDPSTFFDNIGPEPQLGMVKTTVTSPEVLAQAMEGLVVKNEQVDTAADRRRDAWIPNDEAKKTLMKAQSSPNGSFFPEREVLTMPGIVLEEELADALHAVSVSRLGVSAAGAGSAARAGGGSLRAEHVARDAGGLRELLRTGCLRAAINLTRQLIGPLRIGRPCKHSPRSLQLWLTRLALLLRVRLLEPLAREAEPFGDFGRPDMYYQFYPDTYGSRTGSLVPFSLRLLVAELPGHVGAPHQALDRLYAMLAVIRQMLSNLRSGRTEDGSAPLSSAEDRQESLRLWGGREVRVMHSVINQAIALKDYRLAISLLSSLATPQSAPAQARALASALCRLCLQAGHVTAAREHLARATEHRALTCPTADVREYVDQGLIDVACGKYQDAYNNFAKAADQEPTNIMVANNSAVCLLYMGKLKEAIAVLQKAINSDPERGLNESLLINLCTLYELESSNTNEKKLNLLRMLCKYKSDTIPDVLECLKLS